MPQEPRLDLGNYLPYLVNRVAAALVFSFTRDALAEENLSIAMWRVLAALSTNGAQRQIDLAAMTSIDASTLSRLVTRLVRRAFVTRQRSRTNSREVVVALAPKGRALVRRLIPIAEQLERSAVAGLPERDVARVKAALGRIYANLAGVPVALLD